MNRIEEIKERIGKVTNDGKWFAMHTEDLMGSRGYEEPDSLGWVRGGKDAAGQNAEFVANAPADINYLLSKLEIAEKALEVVCKHISGEAEKFSEREKTPVLYQINEALQQLRE